MKVRFLAALLFVLTMPLSAASTAVENRPAGQQGRVCHLPGYDQALRCITVPVPLDYQHPDGQQLMLHVTLAPALREAAKPDPLFVLAGGPGQAGSEILPLIDTAFHKVRATRDLVFIDQRGTGLSGKLDCADSSGLEERTDEEQEKIVAACMRSLNKPFAFYTTDNATRDLDRVRDALGYARINVWGASYGTRLAQRYARRFPDQVRALILDAVAAPDQIIFAWGRDAQAALDAMFQRCAMDAGCNAAYPTLRQQFAALLQQVGAGSVTLDFPHPRTARKTHLHLSPERFLQTVRTALYSADSASRLPFLIASAAQGDWGPFLAQMTITSDFSLDGPALGLMLAVTCAEDLPRLTPAIVADEERNSFLNGMEVKLLPRWCPYVNVPAVPYAEPTRIAAPALLLSGALDPVTPPARAARAAHFMPQAQQFVAANAAHGVSQFGCAPRLLREFLDDPMHPLAAQCLKEISPSGFQLGAAGPHP